MYKIINANTPINTTRSTSILSIAAPVCPVIIGTIAVHVDLMVAIRHALTLSHHVLSYHEVLILTVLTHIIWLHGYIISLVLFAP